MANYVKIEATGGGSSGTGLWKILFYDQVGALIPLTINDVVYHTANSRISVNEFNSLFVTGSSYSPPYVSGKSTSLIYIIKFDEKHNGFSRVSIQNWVNNSYHAGLINISFSEDDIKYEPVESQVVEYNVSYDFLREFLFMEKKILLKSNNIAYAILNNDEDYNISMTSDTAPSPFKASASSIYSTVYNAWKAFNGTNSSNTDCWSSINTATSGWIQLDFGKPTYVNRLTLEHRAGASSYRANSPSVFDIQGSNDGFTFTTIQSVEITDWLYNEPKTIEFINHRLYKIYRLDIKSNLGRTANISIGKLTFSYKENEVYIFRDTNHKNLLKYGAKKIELFSRPVHRKNYILQDTVSENADGLWLQEIDRKPLSIKFE